MSYKDAYDQLSDLCKKYCLISGNAEIIEGASGRFEFESITQNHFIVVAGCYPDDLICKSFVDFECAVNSPGSYDFRALLSWSSAQIGNYPPPNVEAEAYMLIEHIEYKKSLK